MSGKTIGGIIADLKDLQDNDIRQIIDYQQTQNVKFGEAAVALGYAKKEDVLWALSQQFDYPYTQQSEGVNKSLVVASNPFCEESESFRDLRTQVIQKTVGDKSIKPRIGIFSNNRGDGKTYTASNLALSIAQLDLKVAVLDCNLRAPSIGEVFDVQVTHGLSTTLASFKSDVSVFRPLASFQSLFVLPVGVVPPNPVELLQKPNFKLLMEELSMKFDYVIVDTPAMTEGADSQIIAGLCTHGVIVCRDGQSKLKTTLRIKDILDRSNAEVIGAVLNKR
ncbi:polysaccharide biosynthesis tyrosine autokinase [Aquabacterium lacunae]|uniref:Polysaccharide biosynthesis tyrosine autokinase n=1 Tax=Aquabacterium lacunae TaxID=2528630 RepID=A0A4V2JFC5_9BURK|nr:polysaccharide biosynthesis tyrosine autokinase [Aquabacterium lacunae]TBO28317.1 polysaccharide biosynthesis tyrosine autokinase [Aquabacterium lacunae]